MKVGDKVEVIEPMKCDLEDGIIKGSTGKVVEVCGIDKYPNVVIVVEMNGYSVKFLRWQVEVIG